jgi:LPS-assembly lipoprotein
VGSISEASATIQVNTENEPTAAIETVRASYTLTDSSGTVVATGKRQFMASYDVPRQEFAAVRARIDAENRAARELAELLRLALAHDLKMGPAGPDAPATN